ncbi:tetratricopeptide repeat protein [Solibacillus daqui]|uniref:tetratricopeptide repeat protein n=1 Tax=Solibacillus daqui TaxID=2912187 RepID=UPI0023650661|nr:tetratricopeptide repeat protein [Solibacillus daqui]
MENNKSSRKVILFPGTVERLFNEAKSLAELNRYHDANELFEQALLLEEGDEVSLSVFAYSLYETKSYERAKEICEDILAKGPNMYFEVMELYLTICMQLRQFKQVEKIIQSLLDEDIIPSDEIDKFTRLKKLNAEIAENQEAHLLQTTIDEDDDDFDAHLFLQLTVQQQLLQIHEMTDINIRPFVEELKIIIETESVHPFIQSLLLILLVEQQVNIPIALAKFNHMDTINPAQLELPTKLPQFQEVMVHITEMLEQDPTMLEAVNHLVAKHAIVLYPFEWSGYNSEDVANSYVNFVKTMFGEILEAHDELEDFLQKLEYMTDLQR